ncbi:AAA family ATPase [Nocardia huaxiensis]|uniref:AAA family ATPase n=1 Tax=Nocardia huaxiensis TaxID=2755382 RepID=A0A7D6Z791_9NOCA|nr:AAA family ATPase [Nocardia huaxiensis]QLY28568.1 AAA family ATPase [Nocardia huaxiensis]
MAPNHQPFAQVRETHTGVVFLCGERAYKVKKPVVTDFLDFGTAAARERACARELELNRRFAPDVYLGLAQLSDPTGGPDEPVIVMRRMPDSARLADRLDADEEAPELSALAELLARLHDAARRGPEISAAGTPAAVRARWQALLHSLREQPLGALDPDDVEYAELLAGRFLDGRGDLLAQRIAQGRIVDGHGDLLAEDIFVLPDGFRILDCLDFDDALRYVDRLDDAAFLAMDLEFRGHSRLAEDFLREYLRRSGDAPPASLRHHYLAYRALVRAKTDRLRAAQGDPEAGGQARRHLRLTLRHLAAGAVRLVLVGGLPGTGKSTVAAQLGRLTGAEVISSDTVRAELRARGAITGRAGVFGAGAYRPQAKHAVYTQMLERARERLAHGVPVILDAAWTDVAERRRAVRLATDTCSDLVQLCCTCPGTMAAARMRTRAHGDSEATPAIAEAMAVAGEYWCGATLLDTTDTLEHTVAAALREWDAAPLRAPRRPESSSLPSR